MLLDLISLLVLISKSMQMTFVTLDPFNVTTRFPYPPLSGYINATTPPDAFDPRRDYPECRLYYDTMGMGSAACGDCWAQSFVAFRGAVMCIKRDPQLEGVQSAFHVLTCGHGQVANNCRGVLQEGLVSASKMGTVTGANQCGRKIGCVSYDLPPCRKPNFDPSCPNQEDENGRYQLSSANCSMACDDPSKPYFPAGSRYRLDYLQKITMDSIKQSIIEFGSIVAAYWVGPHFKSFSTTEVFDQVEDDYVPGTSNHFLLIFGWNTTVINGEVVPYWWGKNSWGVNWGDRGYFKIRQGQNLNGIESQFLQGQLFNPECEPLLFTTLRVQFLVNGDEMACYSLGGGKRCRQGCVPHSYSLVDLEFACFGIGSDEDHYYRRYGVSDGVDDEYFGTVRRVKIPYGCIPE